MSATVTISPERKVELPEDFLAALGLHTGDEVCLTVVDGLGFILEPPDIRSLRGSLANVPDMSSLDPLLRERPVE